jgi:predicted ATPase/DNA-binding SARP family transcriptional activator
VVEGVLTGAVRPVRRIVAATGQNRTMQIAMLGPLDVRTDDGVACPIAGTRLSRLLIILAVRPGAVVPASAIVDAIWGDAAPDEPANAVQALVSRLRRSVPGITVTSRANGYVLDIGSGAVDVETFTNLVADGQRTGDRAMLADALRLWRGVPLADAGDAEFAQPIRVRLEETRLAALQARIALDIDADAADIAELEELVSAYPLREALIVLLMRALDRAGDRSRALAVFDEARKRMADELGIAPAAALADEHVRILRAEPAEPPAAEATRTNLRAELSSFVGRDRELAGVTASIGEFRLVTLIGPGGAGKTRLAAHAARACLDDMRDGVWMIEFAPITDPADVLATVLTALGVRERGIVRTPAAAAPTEAGPRERLFASLSQREALLIFDNCEHLIEATAELAAEILGACPGVRVLATSRAPLGVPGEVLWPVEPLALPPDGTPADELGAYPSVRLFAQRAAAVRPGFAVTAANADAVVRICRALDGMPLAIELAAARMRALSPEQIAERLGDRFAVLTGGSRTALPRHQTLRAVVDWSWDLLDDDERALWRRLSVFSGGATIAAAAAVVADRDPDVLDTIGTLVDKSILQVRDDAPEPRYWMLETIRAYGQMRLDEAGDRAAALAAHGAYFSAFALSARDHLIASDQLEWIARLSADHDNLITAVRNAIAADAADLAVGLVSSIGWYWRIASHRREGIELAVLALAMIADTDPDAVDVDDPDGYARLETQAAAYAVGAFLAIESDSHVEHARGWFERCSRRVQRLGDVSIPMLRLVQPLHLVFDTFMSGQPHPLREVEMPVDDPDPWVAAMALIIRAHIRLNFGRDHAGVEADFRTALDLFRRTGERWGRSFAQMSLATLEAWHGEIGAAIADIDDGIRALAELGVRDDIVEFRAQLVRLLWLAGDTTRARAELALASRESDRLGLPQTQASIGLAAADIARFAGDPVLADHWVRKVEAIIAEQTVASQTRALLTSSRGYLAAVRGDADESRRAHREAVELAVGSIDAPVVAWSLVGLADVALADGDGTLAARILGASTAIRGVRDLSHIDGLRVTEQAMRVLGPEAFDRAYAQGMSATRTQISDLVGITMPELTAAPALPETIG